MKHNEKRYFLRNSSLLEEVHKSKLTYCCYEKEEYGNYDLICDGYSLITPNILSAFFNKHKDKEYCIIRVMTDEHVLEFCKNGKINLQELKMGPFKHFLITRTDFEQVYKSIESNFNKIEILNNEIHDLREQIKDNNRNIRLNQLNKPLQVPYKEKNKLCRELITYKTNEIKTFSDQFSKAIMINATEVLRSHWHGKSIETGEFDLTNGKLSEGLVHMIIMLVDQFAKSGNWSGYTYIDDMKGSALMHLCDVSLKFEEVKSTNVFSYLTQVASNKFTATLNSEKAQRKIKSKLMQEIGYDPTFSEQLEDYKQLVYNDDGILVEEFPDDSDENDISTESTDENIEIIS